MTDRIAFLREETLNGRNKTARRSMPAYDVSRQPGSIPVRKALAFQTICENMPVYIGPWELIVGTRTFYNFKELPAGTIDWSCAPLLAYPKFVNDDDIARFGGDYSGVNSQHYTPDLGILLDNGIGGIVAKAQTRKADSGLKPWHLEFLDSVILAYTGMGRLIARYAGYAEELSLKADCPQEKERLHGIAECCRHISLHKPRNFREAVQLLWFSHLGTILESGLFINYGRLDVILQPYLGDTPHAEAEELLSCLLLKMYDQADIEDHSYLTRHEGQLVVTLGGVLSDGENAVGEVTMLFLKAIGRTRLPEPEFNLRVSSKNPPEYLEKAAELTVSGCNFLSYYNDDAIIPALIAGGLAPEDARCYGFDLCQDLTIPGKADFYNIFGTSLVQDLMALLEENQDYETFEGLLGAFKEAFSRRLAQTMILRNESQEALLRYGEGDREGYFRMVREGTDGCWEWRNPMCPLPYLSGMFHGCIEKAMDMIYEPYPIKEKGAFVGTAVEAVNSLAAIRQVVFDRKSYSLREVVAACRADFAGAEGELLRRVLWNAPKWGNDDDRVDAIAQKMVNITYAKI